MTCFLKLICKIGMVLFKLQEFLIPDSTEVNILDDSDLLFPLKSVSIIYILGICPVYPHFQNFAKRCTQDTLYVCHNYYLILITNLFFSNIQSYLPYQLNF